MKKSRDTATIKFRKIELDKIQIAGRSFHSNLHAVLVTKIRESSDLRAVDPP